MPLYAYVALDAHGRKSSGRTEADSEPELKARLKHGGYFLVEASPEREDAADGGAASNLRLDATRRFFFTERLEILVKAGVTVADALRQIADDDPDGRMGAVARELARVVAEGRPLSEALGRCRGAFDDTYRAAVEAGEHSGALDQVLATLGAKLQFRQEMRRGILGALAYPAALLAAVLGLFAVLLFVLVPRIVGVFDRARVDPPAITVALVDFHRFVVDRGALLGAAVVALALAGAAALRMPGPRRVAEEALYRTPVLGKLLVLSETSAFVGVVGLLHRHGVTLARALEIATGALRTARMRAAVGDMLAAVRRGEPLEEAMRLTRAFPALAVQMTAVGRRSGELDAAFDRVETFLRREIPRLARR
ncbi:MAG TPA: type II secretion system F family protein, partial [Planctomycetota bacterium]|nr:type II secretion system F family protein [Planctomycetota bacterium]